MNAFNTSWTSALSMTLLHSLWQGLLITIVITIILKIFPNKNASAKYLIKTGAFFLVFASSLVTFFLLSNPAAEQLTTPSSSDFIVQPLINQTDVVRASLTTITQFLQTNQSMIVMGWVIGVVVFSLRFVSGIAYMNYLRLNSLPVTEEWNALLDKLSKKSGVQRIVTLYESISVHSPLVIGYLKPIILMPIGLMSGLSTQQVEVILIHELAHIRRHDYLINFIQSLGETIFFFNPFVWMLSSWIRNERENCCDDIVLSEGYDPKLYATTLFELETSRVAESKLALALTGNKNQLLNRIKRIMERSAKNQSGKEKFIPIVLLVLGLVFASWLSINPKDESDNTNDSTVNEEIAADTAKQPKVASYSRKSIITYDEKGVPHEEVVEEFEGDEDLHELAAMPDFDFDIAIPEMAEFPAMPEIAFDMAPMPSMNFMPFTMDTLPGVWNGFDEEKMKVFEKEFQNEFKSKFGDFYTKNQKEMEKIMKDVQAKMNKMDNEWEMAALGPLMEEKMRMAEGRMREAEDHMRLKELDMSIMKEKMREQEGIMKKMEKNMDAFNKEVKDKLVEDGYLGKDEKIETLNFSDDGSIKVNGKSIKSSDHKKYSEMHQKYFDHNEKRRHHRPE